MPILRQTKNIGSSILSRNSLLRDLYIRKRCFQEMQFLQNPTKFSNSKKQSIIYFTLHKCASVYVNNTLRRVIKRDKDITSLNLSQYYSFLGQPLGTEDEVNTATAEKLKEAFGATFGYYFGPFRHPRILNLIDKIYAYKILLMLRDPRDVLTSAYYSFGFTHILPIEFSRRKVILERRHIIANQSVDEFVLSNRRDYLGKYRVYCKELLNMDNVHFVKYEDMCYDFEGWLYDVLDFLNIDLNKKQIQNIISKFKSKKVLPSNHRNKLKPETIEILNHDCSDILTILQYQ